QGSSANKYLLLATEAFAGLPGAPTPDFILPAGFFSTSSDKLWYSELRNYDSFNLRLGALTLDGVHPLRVTNYATETTEVVENQRINCAGQSGAVVGPESEFVRGDCNDDGTTDLSDAIFLLDQLFVTGAPLGCEDSCDANDDGSLDVSDAVRALLAL